MELRLVHGRDGWVEWLEPPAGCHVYVRAILQEDGRLEPAEVHVQAPQGITSEVLRTIPMSRIEAALNAREIRERLIDSGVPRAGENVVGTVMHELRERRPGVQERTWSAVQASLEEHMPYLTEAADEGVVYELPRRTKRSLRISVPAGRSRGDDFYRQVADRYSALAQRSSRPAAELAEANEVPVTTVHRWIKEARRRGILAPGRKGRAG